MSRWDNDSIPNDDDTQKVKIQVNDSGLRQQLSDGKRQLRKIYTMEFDGNVYRYGGKTIAAKFFDTLTGNGSITVLQG